ncbi:MAG: SPOR domain-containing protein [Bacteroidia bacterium]|nr:SPOR domain-containing protein [Bacteroidia bacterium]
MENFARTSHYISELLYDHDCVIVPQFGGFVCTYIPAKIHPGQHIFNPPSKQVFFNRHLQNNDGLLTDSIASSVPCTFEEAKKDVESFVSAIKTEFAAGNKVELPHLGTMHLDPEGNISFESNPDVNFLINSFGLGSFQSLPVIREKAEVKEEPIIRELNSEPVLTESTGVSRVWKVAAMISMPLIAAGILFTFNDNLRGSALAGLGISSGEPALYESNVWFTKPTDADSKNEIRPDAAGNFRLELDENSPGLVVNIHKAAPDTTRVEMSTNPNTVAQAAVTGRYYVIGGAFGVPQNAENYRRALISKGYKATVLENLNSKLTHISIASFDSKEEATQFLTTIRMDIPEAWLLKRK